MNGLKMCLPFLLDSQNFKHERHERCCQKKLKIFAPDIKYFQRQETTRIDKLPYIVIKYWRVL